MHIRPLEKLCLFLQSTSALTRKQKVHLIKKYVVVTRIKLVLTNSAV